MQNIKIVSTSVILILLCFGTYSLLADYQIKGSLSARSGGVTKRDNYRLVSRIGVPISGNSTDSTTAVNSGFGNLDRKSFEKTENLLSTLSPGIDVPQITPSEFTLFDNYPNPFNPATTIRFDIPVASAVAIKIYDIRGQEVASFVNGQHVEPGSYAIHFDASGLSTGIYIYRITAGTYQDVKKMMLMK